MVHQQENVTMNKTVIEQAEKAGEVTLPSPSMPAARLLERISVLEQCAAKTAMPHAEVMWPEGFMSPSLSDSTDAALWEEILTKYDTCQTPAKLAAQHFNKIVEAGMDANAVPFPCMPPRNGHAQNMGLCAEGDSSLAGTLHQDTHLFPFLAEVPQQWTNSVEEEVWQMLLAGRAKDPLDLRRAVYTEPPLDMELLPWATLPSDTVMDDVCTDAQMNVFKVRLERPLSQQQMEKRRAVLSQRLKGQFNPHVFEECLPKLEREAALLDLQATRARNKADETALYDQLAAQGALCVSWPIPNERCWPDQSSAWKNHCKWVTMWRSRTAAFTFKPMKRSNSMSSIGSWAAVSDISWVEVESKASECGWHEVLDEQAPLLAAAKPTLIPKGDIVEIKSMSKPPSGVCLTMEVMCVLLQIHPAKTRDGGADYWSVSKGLLDQSTLLDRLNALNDYLPAHVLEAVAPYMSREDFAPEVIGQASLACKALCVWARELYKYHTLGQASAEASWREFASKPVSELVLVSENAMDEVSKAALQELKALAKPPESVHAVVSCLLHLFAGVAPEVELTKRGNVKDASWKCCQSFMGNPDALMKRLYDFKHSIDAGDVPVRNVKKVSKLLRSMGHALNPVSMKRKSLAAECICRWLISTIAYFEQVCPGLQQPCLSEATPSEQTPPQTCTQLCKADIVELKNFQNPPKPVKIVCVCAGILIGMDADAGWAGAKQQLAEVTFLKKLSERKRSDMTTEQIERVHNILKIEDESVGDDKVCRVSKAASGLLKWVRAMMEVE